MIGLNRGIHAVEISFFELQAPFFKEMNVFRGNVVYETLHEFLK